MEREFDVVVFGATGYVGELIAAELFRTAPDAARVALAGRNLDKLKDVAQRIGHSEVALIQADAFDAASLSAMVERTRVVISSVGPYAKYGVALVGACAQAGTHYVDLCGETAFVRDSIDAFDAPAQASGASIVHACGFDSVPSDIGVLVADDAARAADAGDLLQTVLHVIDFSGGLSGGTFDSLRNQIDSSRTGVRTPGKSTSDPYALSPDRDAEPEPRGRKGQIWLESSADTKQFAAPFFMARYNEQIVRRSNALLDYRYGRGFRYREVHDTGTGALGFVKAAVTAAALPALVVSLATPGLRQVADRILPAPGGGPSERSRERGHFTMQIDATTTSSKLVRVTFSDQRDPGYGSTAVMITQAALQLAAGEGLRSGVLTPAVALGEPYADRLRAQGFVIDATVG